MAIFQPKSGVKCLSPKADPGPFGMGKAARWDNLGLMFDLLHALVAEGLTDERIYQQANVSMILKWPLTWGRTGSIGFTMVRKQHQKRQTGLTGVWFATSTSQA